MKLLLDMNLSPEWVELLTAAHYDALHWSSLGVAHAPDIEILKYAATYGFVVLTHDLDFGVLLATTGVSSPSVVQIRGQAVLPEDIASQVLEALDRHRDELLTGALVTVRTERTRLRVLPIRRQP